MSWASPNCRIRNDLRCGCRRSRSCRPLYAAAVYAASEGLCTTVIEGMAPGGQASASSKIENYLGFPAGISGQQLATRAQLQALKLGMHFAISREVITVEQLRWHSQANVAGRSPNMRAHSSSGVWCSVSQARCRKLPEIWNRGLYYAATAMESVLCVGDCGGYHCRRWQLGWAGIVVSLRYRKACVSPCAWTILRGNDVAVSDFPRTNLKPPYNRPHQI